MRRLLIALGALLVALLAAEAALRLLAPQPLSGFRRMPWFVPDEELGFVLAPGSTWHVGSIDMTVRINDHGMRDEEPVLPKPDDVYRVLGLGDSVAFGAVAPQHNYQELAVAALGTVDGRRTELVNAGIPGHGTVQALGWLRRHVEPFEPDAVLLSFTVGNDVSDNAHWRSHRVVDGHLATRPDQPDGLVEGPYEDGWSALDSHLVRLWRARAGRRAAGERLERMRATFDAQVPDALQWITRFYVTPPLEAFATGWEVTERALEEMRDLCRARGIPLLVVLVPHATQVDETLRARILAADPGRARYRVDPDEPQRRLLALGERLGVPMLDLLPVFAAHADEDLFLPMDHTHPNVRGNALMAEALTPFLREHLGP